MNKRVCFANPSLQSKVYDVNDAKRFRVCLTWRGSGRYIQQRQRVNIFKGTVMMEKRLILASASPRRRDLMIEGGYRFEVMAPQVDEPKVSGVDEPPELVAKAIALFKAEDVARLQEEPAVVLGADTLVACENDILGKPEDANHARDMLHRLSRTRHRVITGVALIDTGDGRKMVEACTSWITMRAMSEDEIESYIAGGEWEGKAGGYAVQETADRFIVKIDGSFTNVVGLPMELIGQMLPMFGLHPF
jgi:septum formation protein